MCGATECCETKYSDMSEGIMVLLFVFTARRLVMRSTLPERAAAGAVLHAGGARHPSPADG